MMLYGTQLDQTPVQVGRRQLDGNQHGHGRTKLDGNQPGQQQLDGIRLPRGGAADTRRLSQLSPGVKKGAFMEQQT
eukprot:8953446-Prorocentrum_lima.AAC.1